MLRKTRESWEELWVMQKESFKWLRKHWKGYSAALVIAYFTPMAIYKLVTYINEKRDRKNKKLDRNIEP